MGERGGDGCRGKIFVVKGVGDFHRDEYDVDGDSEATIRRILVVGPTGVRRAKVEPCADSRKADYQPEYIPSEFE